MYFWTKVYLPNFRLSGNEVSLNLLGELSMYERMLNKQEIPSYDDMCSYCGNTSKLFQSLNSFLSDQYRTTQEIRFPYAKAYGWGVTHRKGKKLICDVFAEADAFTVMLRLSNEQFEELYKDVQEDTKKLIDDKYPCGGGGWIHFRILSNEHLQDVELLLSAKCK